MQSNQITNEFLILKGKPVDSKGLNTSDFEPSISKPEINKSFRNEYDKEVKESSESKLSDFNSNDNKESKVSKEDCSKCDKDESLSRSETSPVEGGVESSDSSVGTNELETQADAFVVNLNLEDLSSEDVPLVLDEVVSKIVNKLFSEQDLESGSISIEQIENIEERLSAIFPATVDGVKLASQVLEFVSKMPEKLRVPFVGTLTEVNKEMFSKLGEMPEEDIEQLLGKFEGVLKKALSSNHNLGQQIARELLSNPIQDLNAGVKTVNLLNPNKLDESILKSVSSGPSKTTAEVSSTNMTTQTKTSSVEKMKIHSPVLSPKFSSEMAGKINFMINSNIQNAKIAVTPPSLGPMEIKLSVSNDVVSLSIVATNSIAKDAVENSLYKVSEMLKESGLNLGDVNVGQQDKGNSQEKEHASFNFTPTVSSQEEDQSLEMSISEFVDKGAVDYYV